MERRVAHGRLAFKNRFEGGFKLDRFIKMMNMYVRMTLAQSTMRDCNDVLVLTTWVIMPRKCNTWKLLPHFYIYHL